MSKNITSILEPVITEKSTALTQQNKYTFKVVKNASKDLIRKSFHEIFPDRKIKSIKTLKLKGHSKRTKSGIKFPIDGKKVIITIDGPKIEYFPDLG